MADMVTGQERRAQQTSQAQRDAENALSTLRNTERFLAGAAQQLPSSAEKTRRFLEDERNRVAHQASTLETLISKQRLTGVGGLIGRLESAVSPLTRQGKAFETMPNRMPTFNSGGIEWTFDQRLREFRSFVYGKGQKTVPFDSPLGEAMLASYEGRHVASKGSGAGEMSDRRR